MRMFSNLFSSRSVLPAAIIMAAGLSAPQIAQAQGAYVNIGAALLSADLDLSDLEAQGNNLNLGDESADIFMLNARLGYRFNKFIAAEVEGGFGLGGDDLQQSIPVAVDGLGTVPIDLDANIDINAYGAGFVRAILPVSKKFDLFVRGGYGVAGADADVTATTTALAGISASDSISDSIDGFAYGVGAEYHLTKQHGIRFDFAAINTDVQFFSLAYSFGF